MIPGEVSHDSVGHLFLQRGDLARLSSSSYPLRRIDKFAIDCAPESRNGFFVRIFFGFFAVSTY